MLPADNAEFGALAADVLLAFATHDGLVVLSAVEYPQDFNRIADDLVDNNDAPAEGNQAQAGSEVGTRPSLLWRTAQRSQRCWIRSMNSNARAGLSCAMNR